MRPTINNLRGEKKPDSLSNVISSDKRKVKKVIKEVPRDVANLEAEQGESVLAPGMGFFNIGGDKHSDGGTPLLLPDGSFIFSDSKDLKVTGGILSVFGKNPDKKFTPAEISKQYDINKYLGILKDPDSDHYDKATAQMMIDNNTRKLNELAMVQEGMKGFPDGPPELDNVKESMFKKGGYYAGGGSHGFFGTINNLFNHDPKKGDKTGPRKSQKARGLDRSFNKFSADWLTTYGYSNDLPGFKKAVKDLGFTGSDDVKAMQKFLVEQNYDQGNFDLLNSFYKDYGPTNQGVGKGIPETGKSFTDVNDYMQDLVDGKAGVRTAALAQQLFKNRLQPSLPGIDDGSITPATPQAKPAAPAIKPGAPAITDGDAGTIQDSNLDMKLRLNMLQKMDVGNTLFDMATVRKGRPTRYQNYGLEQASQIAQNVRPYDYQSILNEVSKQATNAYKANSMSGINPAAGNAAVFGQAMEQASKVKMEEYNQNAGLYNQNQQQLGQYAAQIGQDKMQNAMLYNDKVETMNHNYDQEVKMLKNQALGKINSYMSYNQGMLFDNMLHPQFTFDPGEGFAGQAHFNPRLDPFNTANGGTGGGNNSLPGMVAYIKKNFNITDNKDALSLALQALRSQAPYDDDALGSRTFTNPYLRQYNRGK